MIKHDNNSDIKYKREIRFKLFWTNSIGKIFTIKENLIVRVIYREYRERIQQRNMRNFSGPNKFFRTEFFENNQRKWSKLLNRKNRTRGMKKILNV